MDCFIGMIFYVICKVTTKEKPRMDSTKPRKRKQSISTWKIIYGYRHRQREKETMEIKSNQRAINKMVLVCLCMSVITLNVNGLNSPFKPYRAVGWIKKQT